MLVVTIDLKSARGTQHDKRLGQMVISNRGTGTPKRGDYDVFVLRKGDELSYRAIGRATRDGTVMNYPRLSYNVWRLVVRALLSAFPEEARR